MFAAHEAGLLAPAPERPFAIPTFSKPKVARDRHVEVSRALYSVPGELIGTRITARADASTVKLYHRGQLLKVHPRQEPGGRWTDPTDLPDEVSAYALRDLDGLARRAAGYGEHVGRYAAAILEHPLPWTKMRQVYRLLGLARRHGAAETDTACARALEVEVINIGLIERMLTRGLAGVETMAPAGTAATNSDTAVAAAGTETPDPAAAVVLPAVVPAAGRFVRDPSEFSARRPS